MEPLLVFADPPSPALTQVLDLAGYPWKAVSTLDAATSLEPDDGWAGAVVVADSQPELAFALCRLLRKRDMPLSPLLLVISRDHLPDLEPREDLFDDFCLGPLDTAELDARLDRHTAESEVRRELEEFNARVMKARYTPVDGPPLATMPRDVEAEVEQWRERLRARREAARQRSVVRREAPPPKARRRWWRR